MTLSSGTHILRAHRGESYYREECLNARRRHLPPERISHRGAHQSHPENSIAAFERAIELGADGIELDVHATRDGIVVVHHDPIVHARHSQSHPHKEISDLEAAELEQFLLADETRIPTLSDVLRTIGTRATVYIEIKASNIEPLVTRCIRESKTTCAVHSFDHRIVRNVKSIFPAIRTGILEVSRHIDPTASLAAASAEDLWQEVGFVDAELIEGCHQAGARVVAWTANEPAQWDFLYAIGVDAICTDRIAELATYHWQVR